jgi:hypothetical protein
MSQYPRGSRGGSAKALYVVSSNLTWDSVKANMNIINKFSALINKFETKLAQSQFIPENKTLIKNKLIDLINRKYNTIKSPDKIVISLIALSDKNTLSLGFVYGGKTFTRVDSELVLAVEMELNQLVFQDSNLKVIFNKSFPAANFGTVEVKGDELTLVVQPAKSTNRKIRTDL